MPRVRTPAQLATHRAREKKRYEANKETIAVASAQYRATHKEETRARDKRYRTKNKARLKKRQRLYYLANRELIKARSKAWYESNKERAHANSARQRRLHPDRAKAWEKAWRERNPEKLTAHAHVRAARKSGVKLAVADLEAILASPSCHYCREPLQRLKIGRKFHPRKATLDHLTPLSRGGAHDLSNLVAACAACNFSKNDRTEAEFRAGVRRRRR